MWSVDAARNYKWNYSAVHNIAHFDHISDIQNLRKLWKQGKNDLFWGQYSFCIILYGSWRPSKRTIIAYKAWLKWLKQWINIFVQGWLHCTDAPIFFIMRGLVTFHQFFFCGKYVFNVYIYFFIIFLRNNDLAFFLWKNSK